VLLLDTLSSYAIATDPLSWDPLTSTVSALARVLALPLDLLHMAWRAFYAAAGPALRGCWRLLVFAFQSASDHPLLAIPAVLLFNAGLLCARSEGGALAALRQAGSPAASALGAWVWRSSGVVLGGGGGAAATAFVLSDATFALALLVATQVCAWAMVRARLVCLAAVRAASTGTRLSDEELVNLAATMAGGARMCGACGFGPVDHDGCSDLRHHHGDATGARAPAARAGARVSNACPRCGWFAGSIAAWPRWQLPTAAAAAVRSVRTWRDTCTIVRAAAKGLVAPFALLRLPALLLGTASKASEGGSPGGGGAAVPAVSAFLALSYVVPWIYFNAQNAREIFQPTYHPRAAQSSSNSSSNDSGGGDDAVGCGASVNHDDTNVEPSSALAAILTALPKVVFLKVGANRCV
jgi:hypothetical protein